MKNLGSFYIWSVAVLLILATYGLAMADTNCFATFTSGSGATLMTICFSRNGNLVKFESPSGSEHIRVGTIGEGYVVCSNNGVAVHGYDAAFDARGFGPSTITQPNGTNTFPLTITRNTTDGVFQLSQTFSQDTSAKGVTITMTLKNISTSSHAAVQLARYFDGDIDGDPNNNIFANQSDSAVGAETPYSSNVNGFHTLALTALTFGASQAQW